MNATLKEFYQILANDEYIRSLVTTCIISVNNGVGDTVWSAQTEQTTLRGDGYMYESLTLHADDREATTRFRISPNSFFQTNTYGAEVLFSRAAELIGSVK